MKNLSEQSQYPSCDSNWILLDNLFSQEMQKNEQADNDNTLASYIVLSSKTS
jgi:hypothetical protein